MTVIRAIVFDSNVFGRDALPNLNTIRLWARAAARHDAELWIPEVVAYELAQHAVQAHDTFAEKHAAHRKALTAWGQQAPAALTSIAADDVVGAMEAAGAEIVALDGDDAREAILDQVLLRGVGRRKAGVKTGGADSAWIRSVVAHNGGDLDGVIIVTADVTALRETCDQLELDFPAHAAHLKAVRYLLDDTDEAAPESLAQFEVWLAEEFVDDPDRAQALSPDLDEISDAYNGWEAPLPDDDLLEWDLQARSVGPVTSASITDTLQHDRWTQSLAATIELTAIVEEQYARQDTFGDFVEYRLLTYPGRVRGTLRLFEVDGGLEFDELLEDVELVNPTEAETSWDPI